MVGARNIKSNPEQASITVKESGGMVRQYQATSPTIITVEHKHSDHSRFEVKADSFKTIYIYYPSPDQKLPYSSIGIRCDNKSGLIKSLGANLIPALGDSRFPIDIFQEFNSGKGCGGEFLVGPNAQISLSWGDRISTITLPQNPDGKRVPAYLKPIAENPPLKTFLDNIGKFGFEFGGDDVSIAKNCAVKNRPQDDEKFCRECVKMFNPPKGFSGNPSNQPGRDAGRTRG